MYHVTSCKTENKNSPVSLCIYVKEYEKDGMDTF